MPRTGDVYAPPAGTKGTPDTTIQSSKYNAFVDDLTADANGARPVTAGGTGATNATTARQNLGANNASNLDAGTIPDARLPTSQAGKTFTGGGITLVGSGTETTAIFKDAATVTRAVYGMTTNGVGAAYINTYSTTGTFTQSLVMPSTGSMTWGGSTVWTAANDGAGSGCDADLLDGQQGAYYQNAANLNAGTLPAARLSGGDYTVNSLTSSSNVASLAGRFQGADGNGWVVLSSTAGAGTVALRPNGAASATGQLLVTASGMVWNGNTVWHSGNDGAGSGLDADLVAGYSLDAFQNPSTVARRGGAGELNATYFYNPATGVAFGSDGNITGGTYWGAAGGLYNWLNANKAAFSTSTNANETNFGLGQILIGLGANTARRGTASLYLDANGIDYNVSSGTLVSGLWRSIGRSANNSCAYQKVAS